MKQSTYLSVILHVKHKKLKVKCFLNTATYQKLRGGIPSTPFPHCTTVGGRGMNLRVRPKVKTTKGTVHEAGTESEQCLK